jgi:lactocepin
VNWTATDDGTGVAYYAVFVNGTLVSGALSSETNTYNLTNVPEKAVVEVAAVDYAENMGFGKAAIGDTDIPLIYVGETTPEPFGAYNKLSVPVAGYVTDDLGLEKLSVNGKEVTTTFDKEKGQYAFSTEATFEKDGKYDVIITAIDHSGKEFSIARKVFIDTTGPELTVDAPETVDYETEEVTLSLNLKDNYNYLSLHVDDNHEFEQPFKSPVSIMDPANVTHEVTLPLEHGENTFKLRLEDLAGNETVQEVTVVRSETASEPELLNGWMKEDGKWFFYKDDEKQSGWIKDAGKWYFLKSDYSMATGWVKDGGKWYFLKNSGAMATGWVKDAGKWYFLKDSGAMATGWVKDAGKWYFLNDSGAMKTGWLKDGSTWYYLNNNGAMATDWLQLGSKWYYLNASGKMLTGKVKIGNKYYKFDKNGVWIP